MKQSLRLGTISGIPVGLNWGLLVIAFLYMANLATGILPQAAPGASDTAYWIAAAVTVVLFFGSVLVHELAHSLVAQRAGIRVRAITLWLLGGVAEMEREADNPRAEFRIAAAGPAASMLLGVAFFGAGVAYSTLFGSSVASSVLRWLGLVNAILAVFNLIPAAPLDGGRILAAALWWRSGNAHQARGRAAMVGQAFGLILLAVGALVLLNGAGFWILIIAWFVYGAATAERRRAEMFDAAAHLRVAEAMVPLSTPTYDAVTVAGLLAMYADTDSLAIPVRGADGSIVGIVPGGSIRRVPPNRRETTTAGDLAVPWSAFVSARSDELLEAVVDRFRDDDHLHALVYDQWGNHAGYVGMGEVSQPRRVPA